MSDENKGATPENTQGATPATPEYLTADVLEARLNDFAKGNRDALRKMLEESLEKRGGSPPPQEPKNQGGERDAGPSRNDLDALRKLGRIETKLTEKQQERVDEIARSSGYVDALRFAEAVAEFAPSPATSEGVPPKPQGQARSEASSPARARPESQRQYLALKKADPEFYRELYEDPTFDPMALPTMTREEYNGLRSNGIKRS